MVIVLLVRLVVKKYSLRVASAWYKDNMDVALVPVKYVTYASIAFSVVCVAPIAMNKLGLYNNLPVQYL